MRCFSTEESSWGVQVNSRKVLQVISSRRSQPRGGGGSFQFIRFSNISNFRMNRTGTQSQIKSPIHLISDCFRSSLYWCIPRLRLGFLPTKLLSPSWDNHCSLLTIPEIITVRELLSELGTKVYESVHRKRVTGKECSNSIPKWGRLLAILFCYRISLSTWTYEWVHGSRVGLQSKDARKKERNKEINKERKKVRKTEEIRKGKGQGKQERWKLRLHCQPLLIYLSDRIDVLNKLYIICK